MLGKAFPVDKSASPENRPAIHLKVAKKRSPFLRPFFVVPQLTISRRYEMSEAAVEPDPQETGVMND